MDLTAALQIFAEVTSSIKGAIGIATKLAEAAAQHGRAEERAEIVGIRDMLVSLREQLLTLREAQLELREENAALKEQLERQATEERWERKKMGKDFVMVPEGEVEPLKCPTCFENGKAAYLVKVRPDIRVISGYTHSCPDCHRNFTLV